MGKHRFAYEYPRPALTADLMVYYRDEACQYFILLIKRGGEPYEGMWALPGGYINEGETALQAARRELKEETNLELDYLDFFLLADKPGRDPRGWTVSAVFEHEILDGKVPKVKAGDDAKEYQWANVDSLPELAFDHLDIIKHMFHGGGYYDI